MLKKKTSLVGARAPNVVELHPRITARHRELLARWVKAGQRMGLCDASAFSDGAKPGHRHYILVWVRENPDPAYLLAPITAGWIVEDALRGRRLALLNTLEDALQFIRPVLAATEAA